MLPVLHLDTDDEPAPRRRAATATMWVVRSAPTAAGRDRRVKVCANTRALTGDGERAVRLVGLSARTALLFAPEPVGAVGKCIDLFLPVIGGREIRLTAGIDSVERVLEGQAVTVTFIIADPELRRELHALLALLLAGDDGNGKKQPSQLYDVAVTYGPKGNLRGQLEEISPGGLSMRVAERLAHDLRVDVTVPPLRDGEPLELRGRVTGQRLSREGGYHTALVFDSVDHRTRVALSALLADLMCR